MKHAAQFVLAILLLSCLAGCWPTKFAWSPDGKEAVVVGADGLYLCDGQGKLSPRPLNGEFWQPTWLADGSGLLVIEHDKATPWRQVAAAIPAADRQAIEQFAQRLARELKVNKNWAADLTKVLKAQSWDEDRWASVLACLSDGMDPAAAVQLAHFKTPVKDAGRPWTIHRLTIHGSALTLEPAIVASLDSIQEVRINGSGSLIAYTVDHDSRGDLWVVPMDQAAPPTLVDRDVAVFPDWARDDAHVCYIRASTPKTADELRLATLVRCHVYEAKGAPLVQSGHYEQTGFGMAPSWVEPDKEELAGMVFSPWDKVRCLPDGRILFSSLELTLPTTKADMPTRVSLFAVDPSHTATIQRLIPRGAAPAMPENAFPFELSPDGNLVAAVSGKEGRCMVLSLVTGMARTFPVPIVRDEELQTPAWRSNDQLCILAQPAAWGGKDGPPQYVILSLKGCQVLSAAWPKAALEMPHQ